MSNQASESSFAAPRESYQWLLANLRQMGVQVFGSLFICRGRAQFQQTLAQALGRSELVLILGGQDSQDDNPLEIVCQGIGRPMRYEERVLHNLEERLHRTRANMTEHQLRAALVPQDAQVFLNRIGLYPGIALQAGSQAILLLPHAPREVADLWENGVCDFLSGLSGCFVEKTTLNVLCAPQKLEQLLGSLELGEDVDCTVAQQPGYCNLNLLVRQASRLMAKIRLGDTVNLLRTKLGGDIFGVDRPDPILALMLRLKKAGLTIAVCGAGAPGAYEQAYRMLHRADPKGKVFLDGAVPQTQEQGLEYGITKKQWKKTQGTSPLAGALIAKGAMDNTGARLALVIGADGDGGEGYLMLTDGQTLFERQVSSSKKMSQRVLELLNGYLEGERELLSQGLSLSQVCSGKQELEELEHGEKAGCADSGEKRRGRAKQAQSQTKKKKKFSAKAVLAMACIVFVLSAGYIAWHYYDSFSNQQQVDELLSLLDGDPSFEALRAINPDVKGLLEIEGTGVKYPVLQTTDNTYYLKRDFYQKSNRHGSIYLDYETDVQKPSANMILYGHNMKDGQMFGELLQYKKLEYYQQHPVVQFDTLYRQGAYKIISIFITSTNPADGDLFYYNSTVNMTEPDEIQEFVNEVRRRSLIDTTVDVQNTDTLITLSTCDYSFKDSRFVIVARRVRDGESEQVDTSGAAYNEDPLMPAAWYAKRNG